MGPGSVEPACQKMDDHMRQGFIPKRYYMILGAFLLTMLLYVDRACISSAKDAIAGDLNLSEKQMGWVMSVFAIGYALFQVPSGILADRLGPRKILTAVVGFWSLFTALTAAAFNFGTLMLYRFLFGVGEAGAFPGCARAIYSWIPMSERGIAQGVTSSGSRIGLAFALPVVAWMVRDWGWRWSFVSLGIVGFVWAIFWYLWFRDDPETHPRISAREKELIVSTRQQAMESMEKVPGLTAGALLGSTNMWLVMWQYFCSNFTFFFCLSWLFPYLKETYELDMVQAGIYAAAPPLAGALGNWVAGAMVDWIYRRGRWKLSRQLTAIIGFSLAAGGLISSVKMDSAGGAIVCLSVAIFGADMTLCPSWTLCIDIGRKNAGAVSGTMNMAGNIGSFVTALAFPYLLAWTGTPTTFFFVGAALNITAIVVWLFTRPDKPLEEY